MEIQQAKFGDALNEWFRAMGRNWRPLIYSALVVHVPLAIVVAIVFWTTGAADSFDIYLDPEIETMPADEMLEAFTPLMWATGVWIALQLLSGSFVFLAASRVVAAHFAGVRPSGPDVSRFAAGKLVVGASWAIVVTAGVLTVFGVAVALGWLLISEAGANFLTVFVTSVAVLTSMVGTTWLGVSVSMGYQVIALEDVGVIDALSRSFALVRGRWWATLGFLALSALIASASSQVASLVISPLFFVGFFVPSALAFAMGLSALLQGLLIAAMATAYSIWYIDLRARHETLMAEQLM